MTKEIFFRNTQWLPYLQALHEARKQKSYYLAKKARWLIPGIIVFVGVWIYFGINAAVTTLMITMFFTFQILLGKNSLFKPSDEELLANSNASLLEKVLLQEITTQVSPHIKLEFRAPSILQPVRDSGLVSGKLEFVNAIRSLSGLHEETIPFCATYIEAGYMSEYRDSKNKVQKVPKYSFKGIFLIMDFPKLKEGWVKIRTDKLEALSWIADEWRSAKDENYIRVENPEFEKFFHVQASDRQVGFMNLSPSTILNLVDFAKAHLETNLVIHIKDGVLTAATPLTQSPFLLRNNEALWEDELDKLRDCVELVAGILDAFTTSQSNVTGRSA